MTIKQVVCPFCYSEAVNLHRELSRPLITTTLASCHQCGWQGPEVATKLRPTTYPLHGTVTYTERPHDND